MDSDLPKTLRLYRGLLSAAVPLTGAVVRRRLKRGKEDPSRIGERRGIASRQRPAGPLIWVHGASVGEVLAVGGLIEQLRAHGITILLTSGTVTSASVIGKRFAPEIIHQYVPYDAPRYVSRFLDHWQPSLALFVESDLWPNVILSCANRRIPMVLVNGRMSQRSFPRWQQFSAAIAALLERFDLCLVQSGLDADRFSSLGARDVVVTGNLKMDVAAPPADQARFDRLISVVRGRPIVVAASTHPGEDELVVAAHRKLTRYFPGLLTVIVPRHPERGEAIARMVAAEGLEPALRSQEHLPSARTDIYIGDTMGEMGLYYRLSPVVFVGGSLVNHGGQNPIEAIKLGGAVIHGPHVFNFTEIYEALDGAGGAARADTAEALAREFGRLLSDAPARQLIANAGAGVVDQLGGALRRTLNALEPYLLQLRLEQGARDA